VLKHRLFIITLFFLHCSFLFSETIRFSTVPSYEKTGTLKELINSEIQTTAPQISSLNTKVLPDNNWDKEFRFIQPFDTVPQIYHRSLYGYKNSKLIFYLLNGEKGKEWHLSSKPDLIRFNYAFQKNPHLSAFDIEQGLSVWTYNRHPVSDFSVGVPYICFRGSDGFGVLDFYSGQELWFVKKRALSNLIMVPGTLIAQTNAKLILFNPAQAAIIKTFPVTPFTKIVSTWSTGCLVEEKNKFRSLDFSTSQWTVMPFTVKPLTYFRNSLAILLESGTLKRVSLPTGRIDTLKKVPPFSYFWISDPYLILKVSPKKLVIYDLEKWYALDTTFESDEEISDSYTLFLDQKAENLYVITRHHCVIKKNLHHAANKI